jgi:hypothetical protein
MGWNKKEWRYREATEKSKIKWRNYEVNRRDGRREELQEGKIKLGGTKITGQKINCFFSISLSNYRVFQKELYSRILNVTVWRVLRKRLFLKSYKLSIVAFKCKNFRNTRHPVTFGITL